MTKFINCNNCNLSCFGGRLYCKKCLYIISKHKQVESKYGFLVDENLINIINKLNEFEYKTTNSCQNNFGKIWIEFEKNSYLKLINENNIIRNFFKIFEIYFEQNEFFVSIRFPLRIFKIF